MLHRAIKKYWKAFIVYACVVWIFIFVKTGVLEPNLVLHLTNKYTIQNVPHQQGIHINQTQSLSHILASANSRHRDVQTASKQQQPHDFTKWNFTDPNYQKIQKTQSLLQILTNSNSKHHKDVFVASGQRPQEFTKWDNDKKSYCGDNFVGYSNNFAILKDVVLDLEFAQGRVGGENFSLIWNQKEDKEFYRYKPGFLTLECNTKLFATKVQSYKFTKTHNKDWLAALKTSNGVTLQTDETIVKPMIAVTRYEYVNLYHTMTDWYNAFLVMSFFNLTPNTTNILVVDGHPAGGLDPVWEQLFNSVTRVGELKKRTQFQTLIMGWWGYSSPLFVKQSATQLPLIEDFRSFFLSSYDIPVNRPLICDKIKILFIWRRPYLAHPRNPSGDVHRKVNNEDDVTDAIRRKYPSFTVTGIQTDSLSMRQQLQYTADADILLGMHGAGLSLCLMLPKHSALVEFMPQYIIPSYKKHFKYMAESRRIIYRRWVNTDSKLEYPDHYTKLPPEDVLKQLTQVLGEMCPGGTENKDNVPRIIHKQQPS